MNTFVEKCYYFRRAKCFLGVVLLGEKNKCRNSNCTNLHYSEIVASPMPYVCMILRVILKYMIKMGPGFIFGKLYKKPEWHVQLEKPLEVSGVSVLNLGT